MIRLELEEWMAWPCVTVFVAYLVALLMLAWLYKPEKPTVIKHHTCDCLP